MNTFVLKLVKISHLVVFLYILLGWLLPVYTLGFYMLWVMTIIVQWELNSGTCLLTNLENYLKGEEVSTKKDEQEGQFLKELILKVCGFTPTDKHLKAMVYLLMYLFFVVALYRYS